MQCKNVLHLSLSAGRIWEKVDRKFYVRVMFITSSKVICKVVEEEEKTEKDHKEDLAERCMDDVAL